MNTVLLGVLAYVLLLLGIGAYVSRRIRTEDDYLVAGRSLGYGLATFTIFATWFGAETCIGAAGSIYESGLSGGSADPFGYGLCLLLMGLAFAAPLSRRKLTTVADLFHQRYSPGVERLAALIMVPGPLFWAAAQVRAFGQVLAASSGLDVSMTITIAALVVVVYTVFGGLLADAWTDLVQGIALLVGLCILLVAVLNDTGSGAFAEVEPRRWALFGGGERPLLAVVEDWAIPVFGSVLSAELVGRIIAARSPRVARRSSLMAGTLYLTVGMIPVAIGLLGVALFPGLQEPEQILPLTAQRYLPLMLYIPFVGALISAILSTVDSALLVAASLVSHNLIVPMRPGMAERSKIWIARGGVAIFGVLAYVLALHAEGVYALVEEASAFGSGGFFIVILFGLFTRFGGVYSALAGLLAGITVWVVGAYLVGLPYPYLASLGSALVAYVGAALIEARLPAYASNNV